VSTLAQRIVRAKAKIRAARLPYRVLAVAELPARLDSVLRVIYLMFNEGYFASSGPSLTRPDLSGEAIRLGRMLAELVPEPEAIGLLALMLLLESRRFARTSAAGDPIRLECQDRSLWNRDQSAEERALSSRRAGPYALQAPIAAAHTEGSPDWAHIVGLYDALAGVEPSPVVGVNRAMAVGMRAGPAAGLALVDAVLARGALAYYQPAQVARADLCRRLGRQADARSAYQRALALTRQAPERRFLQRRLGRATGVNDPLSMKPRSNDHLLSADHPADSGTAFIRSRPSERPTRALPQERNTAMGLLIPVEAARHSESGLMGAETLIATIASDREVGEGRHAGRRSRRAPAKPPRLAPQAPLVHRRALRRDEGAHRRRVCGGPSKHCHTVVMGTTQSDQPGGLAGPPTRGSRK
jgi:hypothetical protein